MPPSAADGGAVSFDVRRVPRPRSTQLTPYRVLCLSVAPHTRCFLHCWRVLELVQIERIEGNGVRTIIAETASLMVQEVGHAMLRGRGIDLIAADNPGSFIGDTPTAKL